MTDTLPAPAASTPAPTTDFDFDALLSEALSASADSKALAAGRKALAGGWHATDAIRQEVLALEAKREWFPRAEVAYFSVQICRCGSTSSLFTGLFQRQSHRELHFSDRWVSAATATVAANLPKEVKIDEIAVANCASCIETAGFPLSAALSALSPRVSRAFG